MIDEYTAPTGDAGKTLLLGCGDMVQRESAIESLLAAVGGDGDEKRSEGREWACSVHSWAQCIYYLPLSLLALVPVMKIPAHHAPLVIPPVGAMARERVP